MLIDNVDSFTYNIADLLHRVLGQAPTVWHHDHHADDLSDFDAIVVGPGPGRPQRALDMGLSTLALRQREVPVLGICLGHQGLAHLAGDEVVELAEPMHGRVSEVLHDGTGLFEGVPSPFSVVRYHSLEVQPSDSSPLAVTARAADDGTVMALADLGARRWGLQFHPESVLSEHGDQLIANFLTLAGVTRAPDTAGGQPVAVGDVHQHARASRHDARPVQLASVVVGQISDTWALHHQLYAASLTAFWLDASAGGRQSVSSGRRASGGREPAAGPPAQALRCSVLGDASGPLSYVVSHRVGVGVGVGVGASVTTLSTGEHLEGPLLPNLATLRDRFAVSGDSAAYCLPRNTGQPIGTAGGAVPTAFRPGFVGYLGYELKAEFDGSAAHVSPFPDARLVFADRALVVDHEDGTVHAVYLWDTATRAEQEDWVARAQEALTQITSQQASVQPATVRPASEGAPARTLHARTAGQREGSMQLDGTADEMADGMADGLADGTADEMAEGMTDGDVEPDWRHTEAAYLDRIAQCQREIRAGESYEICLTNAATWPVPVDETALAAGMRTGSPVPFAAWLRGPGPTVISASPERFVSVTADGFVEARPIKGTRPRGDDAAVDAALAEELRSSVKDRAENLMIVDLLRNDLHRVCRSGSVHVPGIFEVESYATVHQLVSTVRGRLTDGMDCLDVIGTCFPGGSMTGAPKVRTMEILDRLEGGPRGVYSGALGWIGLDGAMDLSIVIRTVTLTDGVAEFGVGGAITALSDPDEEYAETRVKAAALTRALASAEIG
nr:MULTISPECIES: aminodeoxychorismate synthase component I [unclassified Ornithinimicrobium]